MDTLETLWQTVLKYLTTFGVHILEAAAVVFIGLKLARWLSRKVGSARAFDRLDTNLRSFLQSSVSIGMCVVLVIVVCSILGIDTASLITVLASCGVAIGLAMQGALSNVAGGLMIMLLHPFHVNDYVDVAGTSGTVVGIGVFSTTLHTVDNKKIIVPNGSITSATIVNYTTNGRRRVDMTFSAGYDVPVDRVKSVIAEVVNAHPLVLREPDPPFIRLSEQGDSALTYTVRVWTKTADYWTVHFDLLEQMTVAFREKGITIPYPQMDVHVSGQ